MKFIRKCLTHIFVCAIALTISAIATHAQGVSEETRFLSQLVPGTALPENILTTKTLVLHSYAFTEAELETVQEYFQRIGIDAVMYFPMDMVLAGRDVRNAFADQFVKRDINNIAVLEKSVEKFRISLTKFNGKATMVEDKQAAWSVEDRLLKEALKSLQRSASYGIKRSNLLINLLPEIGDPASVIIGQRNEFYAIDMKVDLVAIPKFGDEQMDKELEQIIAANFPFKYKLTDAGVSEKELRKQGLLYVMGFVHTRAKVAQELLGYNTSKSETAVVSVTYPGGQQQLRNIPANTPVYKVYFKHIDSGNTFLGNKWDADLTWQDALLNQIRGMKMELRLN